MGPQGDLSDYTVLIESGKITALGPSDNVKIPSNAQIISMKGKTILPGFIDMHVHISNEQDLLLFLQHGITSVRHMAASPDWAHWLGTPPILDLRKKIRKHQLLGPRITACGRMLDGNPPQNKLSLPILNHAQAIDMVNKTVDDGYDCVKVYNTLSKEHFDTVIKTSKKRGIPVVGHVPHEVGVDRALEAKMVTIEHLNPYVDNFLGEYRIPESKMVTYGQKTAQAGVFNCPTLVVWDRHPPYQPEEIQKMRLDPRYKYISQNLRVFWDLTIPEMYNVSYPNLEEYPEHMLKISQAMLYKLHQGGAQLLIGTDANLPGIYPGSDFHREMTLFHEAGIPNRTILEAATRNAAQALGQIETLGTIQVGKTANLVILNGDPLTDISNTTRQLGVFLEGRWLPRQRVDQWLEK